MNVGLSRLVHRLLARRASRLVARLTADLPPGTTVLDVGSGTGHNAEAIRAWTGATCIEVDVVDFHMVGPGPIRGDGATLPIATGTVDVCLLAFVLNHAVDPVTLLREAGRVTSGRVLILQSTCGAPLSRLVYRVRSAVQGRLAFAACRALGVIPPARYPARPHCWTDPAEVIRLAHAAGLSVQRVEPAANFVGISRDLLVLEPRQRMPSRRPDAAPLAPAVAVVVPARNEVALIRATVGSVLRSVAEFQGSVSEPVEPIDVVVVDNGSTDGTAEALAPLVAAGSVRIVACAGRGAAHARNVGARSTRAPILIFLDADTHLPGGAIERIKAHAAGGVLAGMTRLGPLDGGRRARLWWVFWNAVRHLPLPRAKAMPACMFCTRAAFDEFGPFDERVDLGEEWPILAGVYRRQRRRFVYDQKLTALSSSRRMELQPFGYTRTLLRYVAAVLCHRGRIRYSDRVRHSVAPTSTAAAEKVAP